MTQPPGVQPAPRRTPLSAEEKARAEVNFSSYVAEALAARGRFRTVGDTLRRPVASYSNGREIVITFGQQEPPGLTGQGALSAQG